MFVATYACGKEKRAKVFRLLRSEKRWKKLLIYGFICRKASSAKWWLEWQIIFFILFVRSSRKIFISSQFLIRLRVNLEEFLLGSKASYIYYRRWRVEREWIRFFFAISMETSHVYVCENRRGIAYEPSMMERNFFSLLGESLATRSWAIFHLLNIKKAEDFST